jgi:hypothetical protein
MCSVQRFENRSKNRRFDTAERSFSAIPGMAAKHSTALSGHPRSPQGARFWRSVLTAKARAET